MNTKFARLALGLWLGAFLSASIQAATPEEVGSLDYRTVEGRALIRNMPRASRSSQIPELQKNADGSIDIYFGADAPAGKESNWFPTDPTRKFELMFRLYAPTKALFDKTWQLPDVEETK